MLPQCLKFAFALTFCFQVTTQNHRADNRAFFIEDLTAAADAGVTYLDLLGEVFPGADGADGGGRPARTRLRNLERPREVNVREGAVEFSTAQALWFVRGGEHLLALIVNARPAPRGEEFNVLAVFAPRSRPRLVDAVEIDSDRFVGFWEESPLLPVRQGETAFWVRAAHHNSSEGFHSYHLAELSEGRLRLALSEPFVLTDVKLCGSETVETLKVARERGAFAGRRVFDLTVRTETKPTHDCEGERPARRRTTLRNYRLRWNARLKTYLPATARATRTTRPRG